MTPPPLIRLFGGILLVAGSCIGAGMIALPVVTGMAGFLPSVVVFFLCWLFMMCTGLLLLEVNLWLGEGISIITMAQHTLGGWGRAVAWATFLFLFYCLLIAYAAASGVLVADFFAGAFGWTVSNWVGSLFFTLLIGWIVYLGTRAVDQLNRFLMLGLIATYLALVVVGLPHLRTNLLGESHWAPIWCAIPVIMVSFGFHNMIPSMTTYLRSHARSLRWTVIIGSSLPLIVYLVWEAIILGIVPIDQSNLTDDLATQMLRSVAGIEWVVIVVQYFSFFAIMTSFLAQALSLKDFLADGFGIFHPSRKESIGLILLAILPPLLFGAYYSHLFVVAISVAGGIGAMILFGILPALMVWVGRYRQGGISQRMLFGGRPLLLLLIVIASSIVIGELLVQIGWVRCVL
jgi:tyrosine-specific transport protein